MAQEHSSAPAKPAWTKIFTAFKVALDMKKLLLAAAGIFLAWFGWAIISWTFYGMRGDRAPVPVVDLEKKKTQAEVQAEWSQFKASRASWNFIHELAGSPSDSRPVDAGDVATDVDEYVLLDRWSKGYQAHGESVKLSVGKDDEAILELLKSGAKFKITPVGNEAKAALPTLAQPGLTISALTLWEQSIVKTDDKGKPVMDTEGKEVKEVIRGIEINNARFNVEEKFEALKKAREDAIDRKSVV